MSSNRSAFFTAVTTAGLAISLTLAGCGPQPGSAPTAATSPSATTSASATPVPTASATSPATPEATATAAAPAPAAPAAPAPAAPAPPAQSAAPALKTYMFPDGHISFTYPANWTVRTDIPGSIPGVKAVVSDGTGNELIALRNGYLTGCASGPTSRVVLDQAPVPGMAAAGATAPLFGFVVEFSADGESYGMGLSDPRYLEQGDGVTSGCRLVTTGNGGLTTAVLFNDPEFTTRDAAKAWMATEQYAQLKALLMSVKYS